jgi:hypothetical protein
MSETAARIATIAFPILNDRGNYRRWRNTMERYLRQKEMADVLAPEFIGTTDTKKNDSALFEIQRHIDSTLFNSYDKIVEAKNAYKLLESLEQLFGTVNDEEKRVDKEKWQLLQQRENETVDNWFRRISALRTKINMDNGRMIFTSEDAQDKLITGLKASWFNARQSLKLRKFDNIVDLVDELRMLEAQESRMKGNADINENTMSAMYTAGKSRGNFRGRWRGRGSSMRGSSAMRRQINQAVYSNHRGRGRHVFRGNVKRGSNGMQNHQKKISIQCGYCGDEGHKSNDCITCYRCNGKGHIASKCGTRAIISMNRGRGSRRMANYNTINENEQGDAIQSDETNEINGDEYIIQE